MTTTAKDGSWLIYAVLSAVFASLTAILGKIGISGIDSKPGYCDPYNSCSCNGMADGIYERKTA